MLRPDINEMINEKQDCYTFVVAVAKRAREIAINAEEQHEILEEKPVQHVVEEFAKGRLQIRFGRRAK